MQLKAQMTSKMFKLLGLAAWLPTAEETKEFYRCKCTKLYPGICYSPSHRNEKRVPEADGIKYSKIETALPYLEDTLLLGAGPKFKRKKSFWRALRRGEFWALVSYETWALINRLSADLYNCPFPKSNFIADKYVPRDIMYLIRKNNE